MNVGFYKDITIAEVDGMKLIMKLEGNRYGHRVGDWVNGKYRSYYAEESYEVIGFRMEGGKYGSHEITGRDPRRAKAHWAGYLGNNGVKDAPVPSIRKPRTRKGYDI